MRGIPVHISAIGLSAQDPLVVISATALEGVKGGHEGGDRGGYCGDCGRYRGCHHVERPAPIHLGVRRAVVERFGLLAHLLRKFSKRHFRGFFRHGLWPQWWMARRRWWVVALVAPSHSITSSARARSVGGTLMPRALAVFRFITNSYLVGACTGRSAGFSPLKMRSTYSAACRYWSM